MAKEIMIKNKYDLSQPVQMVEMAQVLKQHVESQRLTTVISGKNYVQVEGWQFAGGMMGLYPRIRAVENLSIPGKEIKWKTDAEIVRLVDEKVMSQGFALCSNVEVKKKSFDEYAILSMSQTRAIGKAYRNLIGWVMKMAGYEATPSEEMVNMGGAVVKTAVPPQPIKTVQATPVKPATTAPNTKTKPPECSECAAIITEAEAKYSKSLFKKPLCRTHQKEAKTKQ